MTATMIFVTLSVFLAGMAIGWRHVKIGGLYLLFVLILVFAVFDYFVDRVVVWPYKYWVIVDLIAVQIGYLVGAALGMITAARKNRSRREPD